MNTAAYDGARDHGQQPALDSDPPTTALQMRAAQAHAAYGQSRAVLQHLRGAVQRRGDGEDTAAVHAAAARGIAGSGGALPHREAIQRSFGRHDVSAVQAHVGGQAAEASAAMGAEAYATGDSVAFAQSPDLHTAAHEAAHVVQQRGGVSLKGGVGQVGDPYERHADAVADRVVQGKSAEDLLDGFAGGAGSDRRPDVQRQAPPAENGQKKVSGTALTRLKYAKEAIQYTKEIFAFGAGNQKSAIRASQGNSYFRMRAAREDRYWEMTPLTKLLGGLFPTALVAARAEVAQGGNCGEHAQVAFEYMRTRAIGEHLNLCSKAGLDHAFVILGTIAGESDDDLAVCDPWPTEAKACIWSDHFAHTSDKSQIGISAQAVGDGSNVKWLIGLGLKLNAEGQKALTENLGSDAETEQAITGAQGLWEHPDAHAPGRDFDYEK